MPDDFEFTLGLNTERNLPARDMATALQSAQVILADVERNVRQRDDAEAVWIWSQEPEFTLRCSVNGIDERSLQQIVTVATDGMKAAVAARENLAVDWPAEFGEVARTNAFAIVNLLQDQEFLTVEATGIDEVEVIPLDVKRSRRLISSVDGVIATLSRFRRNTIYAAVSEWRTGYKVKCYLRRDQWLADLTDRNLWEKHVTVYGRVTYDADGIPVSVTDVSRIDERSGRVKLSEMEGKLSGMTGRLSPEGFVRRLRGGDG